MTLEPQPQEHVQDPETHPAFQAMRAAAIGRPERSMGDSVIPAEPPRWSEVRAHAKELAAEATHLEILTTLVRAALALDGLGGLRNALDEMADTLDRDWAALFPEPDEDDPDEPWYARTNLLADLAAEAEFRDTLLRTPLVSVRGIGAFSARDLDIAAGIVVGDEEERARCQSGIVDGAFAEAAAEALDATDAALDGALDACRRIGAVLEREIDTGAAATVAPITERLVALRARFQERAGKRLSAASDEHAANDASGGADDVPPDAPTVGATTAAGSASAGASSLADHDAVRAALSAVIRYYARHEPGSPVAVLAIRSRELVGRGFFELIGALCPEGEYGGDLATRLSGPRRDPLATLLAEGFGAHLAGTDSWATADDGDTYADEPADEHQDPAEDGYPEDGSTGDDAVAGVGSDAAAPDEAAPDGDDAEGGTAGSEPASRPPTGRSATLTTRADVLRTLDEVIAFYRVHEPSSPVPLVLERMRALVPLDFDAVLDALREALAIEAPPTDAADA